MAELETAWKKVTGRKKESKAFKDVRWPCGRCGKERLAKDYAPAMQNLKRHTLEHTLVEGAWRYRISATKRLAVLLRLRHRDVQRLEKAS